MSKLRFYGPAEYRMTVEGVLTDEMQAMLEPARFTVLSEGGASQSSIVLTVKDQAQLAGILNSLYANHYMILNVENIESKIGIQDYNLF